MKTAIKTIIVTLLNVIYCETTHSKALLIICATVATSTFVIGFFNHAMFLFSVGFTALSLCAKSDLKKAKSKKE